MKEFNPEVIVAECIQWIQDWFKDKNPDSKAVIGMSGGKDSTIAAALLAKALGPNRVLGVAMPDKNQSLNDAEKISQYLNIDFLVVPIERVTDALNSLPTIDFMGLWGYLNLSNQAVQNIPPRVRMTVLYAVAQSNNGFPVNTCNLSEDYLGYATLFGDSAGSFSPISGLTVTELYAIGDYLKIPSKWVHKIPDDGLPHSCSDEEKFGFSYAEVDKFIREGIIPEGKCTNSEELKIDKIKRMHSANLFKTQIIQIPHYIPNL